MTEDVNEEGRTDDSGEEQDLAGNAAEEGAEPAGSVNLDEAEQQVAEWRQEDEALLGETPEVSPVPNTKES